MVEGVDYFRVRNIAISAVETQNKRHKILSQFVSGIFQIFTNDFSYLTISSTAPIWWAKKSM